MPLNLTFAAVIALGALLTLYRCFRQRISARRKWTVCLLRLSVLALVALAFFQPTLRLTRLKSTDSSPIVLIDLSRSMRQYDADSLIADLARAFDATESRMPVFGFGDSLRALDGLRGIRFDDQRSDFPRTIEFGGPGGHREAVLVSDGNWTNASLPRPGSREIMLHYLPLSLRRRTPWLQLAVIDQPTAAIVDSPAVAAVGINGYSAGPSGFAVRLKRGSRTIHRRNVSLDSGTVSDTLQLPLTSSRAGTFLYTVSLTDSTDSVHSTVHFTHTVQRARLQALFHGTVPSLDRRFISLAIDRSARWQRISRTEADAKPDLLMLFSWDSEARALVDKSPRTSTIVFVGALPCREPIRHNGDVFSTAVTDQNERLSDRPLPPPAAVLTCTDSEVRILRTLVSAHRTVGADSLNDSLPLVYEGFWRGKRIVVAAAEGLWRWDFWQAGSFDEQRPMVFSDNFLRQIDAVARSNAGRKLHVYPAASPLFDTDSIPMRMLLPARLLTGDMVNLRLHLINTQQDTTFSFVKSIRLGTETELTIHIPPQPAGNYRYEGHVDTRAAHLTAGDSLRIAGDNAELRTFGQNTQLLAHLASPITVDQTALALQGGRRDGPPETTIYPFRFRQTWYVLLGAVLLVTMEWLLRKRWRLD
jgi:hypothetical protein